MRLLYSTGWQNRRTEHTWNSFNKITDETPIDAHIHYQRSFLIFSNLFGKKSMLTPIKSQTGENRG